MVNDRSALMGGSYLGLEILMRWWRMLERWSCLLVEASKERGKDLRVDKAVFDLTCKFRKQTVLGFLLYFFCVSGRVWPLVPG